MGGAVVDGAGGQSSGALRGLVVATTVVVTAVAVAAVGHGLARRDEPGFAAVSAIIVAVGALLFIGVPAVFMWFNTVRVLGGSPSAAWRVQKHLAIVTSGMVVVGVPALLLTAQFSVLGFLAGAFVVLLACGFLQKRVLVRDRVAAPPPNWHDRQAARAAARQQ